MNIHNKFQRHLTFNILFLVMVQNVGQREHMTQWSHYKARADCWSSLYGDNGTSSSIRKYSDPFKIYSFYCCLYIVYIVYLTIEKHAVFIQQLPPTDFFYSIALVFSFGVSVTQIHHENFLEPVLRLLTVSPPNSPCTSFRWPENAWILLIHSVATWAECICLILLI